MTDPTELEQPRRSRRIVWALVAVGVIAVAGATAGAYLGVRGHRGAGAAIATTPPARAFAAAAYDDATHQLVVFGGTGGGGDALGDTWTWDGTAWAEQHPSVSPPARTNAAMTYDPKARSLVLVGGRTTPPRGASGGCSGSGSAPGSAGSVIPPAPPTAAGEAPPRCAASAPTELTDTWLWTGRDWQQTSATAPSGMIGPSPVLGTDRASGQVLLLTPADPHLGVLRTSVWNEGRWTPLTAQMPSPGSSQFLPLSGALAEDPTTGHLAYFSSGASIVCGPAPAEPQSPPGVPCPLALGPASNSSSASANPLPPAASGQLSLPAGQAQPLPAPALAPCCLGSESEWDGGAWSAPVSFTKGPSPAPTAIAGDRAHHTVVCYTPGGTWMWSGSNWSELHPSTTPGALTGASIAYDPESGRILLFGGMVLGGAMQPAGSGSAGAVSNTAAPVSNALWAWDGSNWSNVSGSAPPNPSIAPATAAPTAPKPTVLPAPAVSPVSATSPA